MPLKKITVPLVLIVLIAGIAVFVKFAVARRNRLNQRLNQPVLTSGVTAYSWDEAVAKVKEPRVEVTSEGLNVPQELKHYSDRHWFLATQVAEIAKYKVHTCQDFIDLAAMIQHNELAPVPAVTDTYVLFGVGEKADDGPFSRFEDDHSVDLYNDAELAAAYKQLSDAHANIAADLNSLKTQATKLGKRERARRNDLQQQIAAREQDLHANEDDKKQLDDSYGRPENRQRLLAEYQSLQAVASNFMGRSYNLDNASDRQELKLNMLRSIRPEALRVMEEVATAYHNQFARPLPVSSLVRPEQYQHALRRVNRNAVLIDTPPHSTGLAFDIDYRYMGIAEQNFLMTELARLKNEGRIEVIRERNANYHVFAFVTGTRPSDDLIAASLDDATPPGEEANHPRSQPPPKTKQKQRRRHPRR